MNIKNLKRLFLMTIFAVSLLTADIKILAAEQEPITDQTSEQSDEPLSDGQNESETTGVEISVTTMMYAVKKVNVRKEPNTSSEILGELEAGTNIFAVELTDEGWYRVVYMGKTGYIRSDFLAVYSNMDMWAASEPEPVPLEEPAIVDAIADNTDNQSAEDAVDNEKEAQEEQSIKKKNTFAIVILLVLVVIFAYAVFQIVRDNMKSDEDTEEDFDDGSDEDSEWEADEENEWNDDKENVNDEWKYDKQNEWKDDEESDLIDDESKDSETDFELMDLDGE